MANSKADMLGTWALGGDEDKASSVLEGLINIGGKSVNVLYAKGSELTDNPFLMMSTLKLWRTIRAKQLKEPVITQRNNY